MKLCIVTKLKLSHRFYAMTEFFFVIMVNQYDDNDCQCKDFKFIFKQICYNVCIIKRSRLIMENKSVFWRKIDVTAFKFEDVKYSSWLRRILRFVGALVVSQLPVFWFLKVPQGSHERLVWTIGMLLTSIITVYILTRWYLKVRPQDDTFILPKPKSLLQIFACLILMWVLSAVITRYMPTGSSANVDKISQSLAQVKLPTVLYAGLFAPIIEELTYRGIFTSCVGDKLKTYQLIIFSGFIFGILHGFPLVYFLSKFLFGMIACYFYRRDHSLASDMLFHLANNSLIFFTMFSL